MLLGKKNPYAAENARRPEVREKIRQSKLGGRNPNWKSKEVRFCCVCGKPIFRKPSWFKFQCCSKECQHSVLSTRMREKNPMFNKEVVERVQTKMREHWQNPQTKMRFLESRRRHPNKLETFFQALCTAFDLPLRFVGDWSFWIGPCKSGKCRNPDFIYISEDNTVKRAVLVGAKYHHEKSWQEEIEDYKSIGWEAMYLWETEIRGMPQICIEKVKEFLGLKTIEMVKS